MTYSPIYTSVVLVQAKTGLSNTEVDLTVDNNVQATIKDAEAEVEMLTGRKFTSGNSFTEYFNGKDPDIIGNSQTSLVLAHYPIQSISLFKLLDMNGDATATFENLTTIQIAAGQYDTDDYWVMSGNDTMTNATICLPKIVLKNYSIVKGISIAQITYTYGYTSVPTPIIDLATCLAGIRCWIKFMGGCYNRLDSYSIPQQNVSKGDFYARCKQNIEMLTEEANRLLDRIGRRPRTLFFATGDTR